MTAENEIVVGNKPLKRYLKSIEILINERKFKKVNIMARGKNILKAIRLIEESNEQGLELNKDTIETGKTKFEQDGKHYTISTISIWVSGK